MHSEQNNNNNSSDNIELAIIRGFGLVEVGKIMQGDKTFDAEVERTNEGFVLRIGEIIDFDDSDEIVFKFMSEAKEFYIKAPLSYHGTSIRINEKLMGSISEGKIYSLRSSNFRCEQKCYYKSYIYSGNDHLIYDFFGLKSSVSATVNNVNYKIFTKEKYVVVESLNSVTYDSFSETNYNIMIAIGFVSGNFIQDEIYIFQKDVEDAKSSEFQYLKIRSSSYSIYHAITHNPFGYGDFIGDEYAERLYSTKTLKPCDEHSFSKLIELIENNSQVQYALVLFNEANNRELSLLIQNNCFFAVLEVLKKFFVEKFKESLPRDYTQKGNIEKYKAIFQNIISLSDTDCETLEKRNVFLHGDIKDVEDQEMVDIMHKQITLIYRLILSYVGFDGYTIDHYAIRNNMPLGAFIKIN